MPDLYLLHGFFGSGKSTWARNFAKEHPDTKIVSADGFRTMLNGEYKYLAELDDLIDHCMIKTAFKLAIDGYNVIIDVGNLSKQRRDTWLNNQMFDRKVLVKLPQKDREWHLKNRMSKPHWDTDWGAVYDSEHKSYESPDETEFDEIIEVMEW